MADAIVDPFAAALLGPSCGALAQTLRNPSGITTGDATAQGARLAAEHQDVGPTAPASTFLPRLRDNLHMLLKAHRYIARQNQRGLHVGDAGNWLIENIQVLAAQARDVQRNLPLSFYKGLPVLGGGPGAGMPRVFAMAWAYVAGNDSIFESDALEQFLDGYQINPSRTLTHGELWALPTTLRVVLIENLRRLAERVATEVAARESANSLCDHTFSCTERETEAIFARMNRRGVGSSFALQVMQRLHDDSDTGTVEGRRGRESVRAALATALLEPDAALVQQRAEHMADTQSVAQAVRALHGLARADWRGIVHRASALMKVMKCSSVFAAEHETTQNTTLHAIEFLARRGGLSEASVAATLLRRIKSRPDSHPTGGSPPSSAPGYWTAGPGRAQFLACLGLPDTGLRLLTLGLLRHSFAIYLATLGLVAAGLATAFMWGAALKGAAPWAIAICSLLAIWPASEVAGAFIHRLCAEWIPPRHTPRLALLDGIPLAHRVLVVIPTMLVRHADIAQLATRLERHRWANPDRHAQFALLTDWPDSDVQVSAGDMELLVAAQQAIDAAQARIHPIEDGSVHERKFLLLHRERRWSESERKWIGWERKRGKIEELITHLAVPTGKSPFVDLGTCSQILHPTVHVLTLDSDTILPPGTLRDIVGVAAHPLNRPRVDPHLRRVIDGHAILQPRVDGSWPNAAQATPYHWLAGGSSGHEPYPTASSEMFSDAFDEASFSGKGLLDVVALHQVLNGRFPCDQVLSHDLVEGAIARCGGVSDVRLLEPSPSHPSVSAARLHRWTRGDWQLLPILRLARQFGLNSINRWKILDNLRRSLVAPMSLVLLGLAFLGVGVSPWWAFALGAAALAGGSLLAAAAGMAPSRDDLALRPFARATGEGLLRTLAAMMWSIVAWPVQAATMVSAIGLALWRSHVSRRHLLQWTTADDSERHALSDGSTRLRRIARALWSAIALGGLIVWQEPPALALAIGLSLVWAGLPLWLAWIGRTRPTMAQALTARDRTYLIEVTRATWAYFDENVNEASNHLPPDNVQTSPAVVVAQRTSPTNIGLYLLSVTTAHAFGWISTEQMAIRLQATLDTLDGLPRHRGHFMNWTDTRTLLTLPPAYVSTVDSGNFCTLLVAAAVALERQSSRESEASAVDSAEHLVRMAKRCRAFSVAAEFGFLMDGKRRLFHIGWRVDEQTPDAGHYDLLASEARLASLWAIAKGDVPPSHWSVLGRPFQALGSRIGLRSWSGSMFEYLMPALILDEPEGTVLASAAWVAVREQIRYGQSAGIPWGISECARLEVDGAHTYQYGPQGIARLAMRSTPVNERVVAPYASFMAAMIEPVAAVTNLRRLEALGARGRWGFIEALDFSPERLQESMPYAPVQTTMAHHQGMALIAMGVVLLDGLPRKWCMADDRIAAASVLLQERPPKEIDQRSAVEVGIAPKDEATAAAPPLLIANVNPGTRALPPTHLLSNGRYSVAIRPNGAGWSRYLGADITRWRDDALRDSHGSFIYLRRWPSGPIHSITQHPAPDPEAIHSARFLADRAILDSTWNDLRVRCTIWIDAKDDIEYRRVEIWNTSPRSISLELFSAFEVCLSTARADEMHPAFANLFVSSSWDSARQALLFQRNPRRDDESALHAAHFVAHTENYLQQTVPTRAIADRLRWRGRLRGYWQPKAEFDDNEAKDGVRHTGLDPVAAIALQLRIDAHGTAQYVFATAAAPDSDSLLALVARGGASARSGPPQDVGTPAMRMGEISMSGTERLGFQILATPLLLSIAKPGLPLDKAAIDRRALWQFGVSGDRPVISVRINHPQGLRLIRSLIRALAWWDRAGLDVDLMVLNSEPHSYLMTLHQDLLALAELQRTRSATLTHVSSAIHVIRSSDLSEAAAASMAVLARLQFHADGRPLAFHIEEIAAWHEAAQVNRNAQQSVALALASFTDHASQTQTQGQFHLEDGRFTFEVGDERPSPRPWINVLANPQFGALVSESGCGFTWAGNSRLHQLSAWGNDPLGDMDGEAIYIQDTRTRQTWRVGRSQRCPRDDIELPCRVEHSPGFTTIHQTLHGSDDRDRLQIALTWCVASEVSVKRMHLRLHNLGSRSLVLRVVGCVEWVMGCVRADRRSVHTAWTSVPGSPVPMDILVATRRDGYDGHGLQTAFLSARVDGQHDARIADWTCDRRELFDVRGRAVLPDRLGQRAGSAFDPCAALSVVVSVGAGSDRTCMFLLGHGINFDEALALARDEVPRPPAQAEEDIRRSWRKTLGKVTVRSPDPSFDALVNHWLPYQIIACRLWARAGFYQAGGAFGFRDQLQDAMALTVIAPNLLREHLLRAAARQFVEGDAQHWWHPQTGAGARTRISDDVLWLAHATLHYVHATLDFSVLDVSVPFIEGDSIPAEKEDAYTVPRTSDSHGTLFEHVARSIDRHLVVGNHGLPLMGSGDWNDGMNRVGHAGRGESVWLAWFLCQIVDEIAPLAMSRGELVRATRWTAAAAAWRVALDRDGWDGAWYRRAFFDDGSPLGSIANGECRIDLIAQAWSVLGGGGLAGRRQQAMASAEHWLADTNVGVWRLLDPPLVHAMPNAGYIQAYPPGIRENGGQYSHAGVWALMAAAQLGDARLAWRTWTWLSPAHRSADPTWGPTYGLEPYVMAADVYSQAPYAGRGGWSWYTGSAAGMHRAALESIIGLQVSGHRLRMQPLLPLHWPSVAVDVHLQDRRHTVTVCAEWAHLAISEARGGGAKPLQVGQWLDLAPFDNGSHHMVICTPGSTEP